MLKQNLQGRPSSAFGNEKLMIIIETFAAHQSITGPGDWKA
jgi:hypothetical protein